jgi:hypothetical protein
MLFRYIFILGLSFICLLNLSLLQIIKTQSQTLDSSFQGNRTEIPATFYVIQNPQTGKLEIKNMTLNDSSNLDKNKLSADLENFASSCDDVLNNQNLFKTNYVVIGKVDNSTYITSTNSSIISMHIHDIKNSDSDKILLNFGNRFVMDPILPNVSCEYANYSLNSTNQTESMNNTSFLSTRCSDQFQDTIYILTGKFNNKFDLNFTSSNNQSPNIKLGFEKETGSNEISGYISNVISDQGGSVISDRGDFTISSVSITCSLHPIDIL